MLRRLYFIVPTPIAVSTLVEEFRQAGIDDRHMTLLARDTESLQPLGIRVQNNARDPAARFERLLWTLNLVIFVVALLVAAALLLTRGVSAMLAVPLLIMIFSVVAGLRFTHVPNVHLNNFTEALAHGELVLMADVAVGRVAEIESLVHRYHPAAAVGGVGWHSDLLHI